MFSRRSAGGRAIAGLMPVIVAGLLARSPTWTNTRYSRFCRARNTGDAGMGMGMAFVQATIRRIGGRIWFDSSEGVGTTFYLQLHKNIAKG